MAFCTATASADSLATDPPPRKTEPKVARGHFRPSWDLDGFYIWLGPTGAATHVDADWDSTFGGDLAVLRIREREPLSAIGLDVGASLWSARDGGRVWVDAVAGTQIAGRVYGVTVGAIGEFAELEHPRYGASAGVWAYFGITPYVRVGTVEELGTFVDVGVHIALPVYRH